LIEEKNGSIEKMVSEKGWEYFRAIEKKAVAETAKEDDLVIATGGGVVLDEENMKNLKNHGLIVWLKGDNAVLKERMIKEERSGKIRPSLTGEKPWEEIERVLHQRTPLYRQSCDMELDTSRSTIREVTDMIISSLPEEVKE